MPFTVALTTYIIDVKSIKYDTKFDDTPPSEYKVNQVIEYYNNNGKIDMPIVVKRNGDQIELVDEYLRLYAAKVMGLTQIDAILDKNEIIQSSVNLRVKEIENDVFETNPKGKILIIGESSLAVKHIQGVLKSLDIPKERVELVLDHKAAKSYHYSHLQYNTNYRLILMGPIPYSTEDERNSLSIITEIETQPGYPKVIKLSDNHKLKITKTSLKNALINEINSGYVEVS